MVKAWDVLQGYNRLETELERLAGEIGGDFAALAKLVKPDRKARWLGIYGARGSRVGRLELKPGSGVGGMAIRLGVPYEASGDRNGHMLGECPVMLAERLSAAIAVPLPPSHGGHSNGVLLVGRREARPFGEVELRQISSKMPIWIELSGFGRYDGGKWNVSENGGAG